MRQPDFLRERHDRNDPDPWLALYLDDSVPMAEVAKRAWLEDVSSRNRQFILPLARPPARLLVALFQLVKLAFPHFRSSMKTFLSPNANLLILRHFHLGSEILRFIADNVEGVDVVTTPLKPRSIEEIKNHLFLQHDLNLYNFVIDLNAQLKEGQGIKPRPRLDFSAISDEDLELGPLPRRFTNFVDLETAIEIYTPFYQLFSSDRDFWRASNSLQLDETIALYLARILGDSSHVALANNKHPLVPLPILEAGFRLVLHGLSTELLHALLVERKREQEAAG